MLAVNDATYHRFSSARSIESILENVLGVLECPGIFPKQESGNSEGLVYNMAFSRLPSVRAAWLISLMT